MNRSTPIRVLIVDSHPVVRRGIAFAMQSVPDIQLVGEAGSSREALDSCERLRPDMVLMDLVLGCTHAPGASAEALGADGVALARCLAGRFPGLRVLMLTCFAEPALIRAALRAGASGYLLKDLGLEELAQAIRMVYCGQTILAPAAMQALAGTAPAARQCRSATGCPI
jgi:two-component system, NarL family, response regulator LiaR